MNNTPTNGGNQVATQPRRASPAAVFQHDMGKMAPEWTAALPEHIPVERFMRVVQTAVMQTPELMEADRKTLWMACTKCAQDGLLPDGREAALVVRMTQGRKVVTYVPMVAGIKKKVRNSGEISSWDIVIVYENDTYDIQLGDTPHIVHKPDFIGEPGKPLFLYSVATFKGTGEVSREVMRVTEINKIRDRTDAYKAFKANKIKSTPWESDWGEMAKKTLAKRHAKSLPMSTDLDDLMRRDDDLYDFAGAREKAENAIEAGGAKTGLAGKLAALAGGGSREDEAREEGADVETGEILEHEDEQPASGESTAGPGPEAGSGGNAAGQGSSPATTAPAAAPKKRGPKPKDQAATTASDAQARPPADPDAIPESLRRTEQPAPQPAPAPQQQAEPAASDEPEEDDEGNADAPLSAEEKKTLKAYHDSMTRAMSPAKLNAFHADIFPNTVGSTEATETANLWYENTTYGRAVKALFDAHFDRVTEDIDITVADALLARLIA